MKNISLLKMKVVEFASEIRSDTVALKTAQKAGKCTSTMMYRLFQKSSEARSHHIAYSEMRGRTRDEIERPKENNPANEMRILQIKEQYAEIANGVST